MKKKVFTVLIALLAITVLAAGIWLIKYKGDGPNRESGQAEASSAFTLEITLVDLDEMQTHGLPVLIDFGSDSCIPCKEMAPVLKTMNAEMQGKAVIHFVDIWKNETAAEGFPIQVIPTQVFYTADGKPYVPGDEIQKTVEFILYSDKKTGEHLFTVHQGGLTEEQMRAILADMGCV